MKMFMSKSTCLLYKIMATKLQFVCVDQAYIFQDVDDNPIGHVMSKNLGGQNLSGSIIIIAVIA